MYRNLLLFLALSMLPSLAFAGVYKCKDEKGKTTFSDMPCATGSPAKAEPNKAPSNSNPQPEPDTPKKEAYTKDVAALKALDAGTQACFINYVNTTEHYPDPSTTKLLTSVKKMGDSERCWCPANGNY